MSDRPYSRIYHELADEYPEVYDGPLLADYTRLLVAAEQSYPTRARWSGLTTKRALSQLSTIGADDGRGALVVVDGTRYEIKGLDKERLERSESARRNATARWDKVRQQSDGNATASRPQSAGNARRDETSRDETRRDEHTARASLDPDREGLPHLTPEVQEEVQLASEMLVSTASDAVLTDLDRLVERHGVERVAQTMGRIRSESSLRPTWPQLVYGTRNRLDPIPGQPDSKTERERVEADEIERRRKRERTALDEPWRQQFRQKLIDDEKARASA